MKKKIAYAIILLGTVISVSFAFYRSHSRGNAEESPTNLITNLLPRKQGLAYKSEWETIEYNVRALHEKVKKNAADLKSLLLLSSIYIQEGRNTGNFIYYNDAALRCINTVLAKDPKNFEGLSFKATILLSQHRFEDAFTIAKMLQKSYPLNAYVYGLLVDANIELGNYRDALTAADQMVSIRPDLRSYSRIAYLREIFGDPEGAVEAMELAVDAGTPGDENTEWCRVQLGRLFEQLGKFENAKIQYRIAANYRVNYPHALSGLAAVALRNQYYEQAVELYQQADSLIPDHFIKEGLAAAYRLIGNEQKAAQMANAIIAQLQQVSSSRKDATHQNEDLELAHAYAGTGDYARALEFALLEFKRRPGNIEVNETVAIMYFNLGVYEKALPYINAALSTNNKKPELLAYAGLIFAKTGDKEKAKRFLQKATVSKGMLDPKLHDDCSRLLKKLSK